MKETFNLREAAKFAMRDYYNAARTMNAEVVSTILDNFCNEIEKNHRCPHITGNPEGSQWCQLAESSVTAMGHEIAKLKERLEAAQRVVEAARKVAAYNMPEGNSVSVNWALISVLEVYDVEMKDDSLGEKSDNTPQL